MRKLLLRGLYCGLVVGGLSLLGAGVANAAESSGDDAILPGSQVGLSVTIPIDLGGNALSLLGDSESSDSTVSEPQPAAPAAASETSGDDSVGSGSQAIVNVEIPIDLGGNAISFLGDSSSSGSTVVGEDPVPAAEPAAPVTGGDDSILGGTQGIVDIAVPVNLGGNAISLIGDSSSEGSAVASGAGESPSTSGSVGSGAATTSSDDGIASGTQLLPVVDVPVAVGGNAISLIGDSSSSGSAVEGGSVGTGTGADAGGAVTSGDDAVLGGTQIVPVVGVPVTVGGNAIAVVGDSSSDGSSVEPGTVGGGLLGGITGGDDGILGGAQLLPVIDLPITVGGNAISVIGDSDTGGSTTIPGDPGDPGAPGDPGTPGAPGDPGTPGDSVTSASDGEVLVISNAADSGSSSEALAETGVPAAPALGAVALLLLLGLAAAAKSEYPLTGSVGRSRRARPSRRTRPLRRSSRRPSTRRR